MFVYPIFSLLLRLSDPHGSSLARVCVWSVWNWRWPFVQSFGEISDIDSSVLFWVYFFFSSILIEYFCSPIDVRHCSHSVISVPSHLTFIRNMCQQQISSDSLSNRSENVVHSSIIILSTTPHSAHTFECSAACSLAMNANTQCIYI